MTDEYRAFLESRKPQDSDHQDIPHWKPSDKKEESESSLAHYGIPGMKWGVIKEEDDKKLNKPHGKVYETVRNAAASLGVNKAEEEKKSEEKLKEYSERGSKRADYDHLDFTYRMGREDISDQQKTRIATNYVYELSEKLSADSIGKYREGDPYATMNVYEGAKAFDLLMQQYAENSGASLDENRVMQDIKEGIDLDKNVDSILKDLGIPQSDSGDYKSLRTDFKYLLYETGYTDVNEDPTRLDNPVDQSEEDKEGLVDKVKKKLGFKHSELVTTELPYLEHCSIRIEDEDYLAHHGIDGMHWGVRRWQYKNGALTPAGILRYRKNGNGDGKEKKESSEEKESKPKKEQYNSKTLTYKAKAQHLTDEELDRRNRRMQREVQYNQLRSQLQPKSKAERRKELRRTIFVATATTAAAAIMTQVYKKAAVFMINKASGGRIDLSSKGKKG